MASLRTTSTLPSTITGNNQLQPAPPNQMNNILDDQSSIAMFTAVGHVGLHLVIRPLVRWGMRSFLLPAKQYIDDNEDDDNDPNNDKKNNLMSESQIESELEENKKKLNNNNKLRKNKKRKLTNLANVGGGIAGPYSEVVFTFGALAGISQTVYPHNILLYFGVTFPSMPFILRFFHSLNDKKMNLTLSRSVRLISKSLIVTGGFGVSMALVGVFLTSVPFFNIFCLAFWDAFADFIISDGPNK